MLIKKPFFDFIDLLLKKIRKLFAILLARLVYSGDKERFADCTELKCIYKWGFDGASGQSQYKQIFNSADSTDKSILMTSVVPLQVKSDSMVFWQNPQSSSTRFCRPIRFEFIKETKDSINIQYELIQQQINVLKPTVIMVNEKELHVTHQLELTMVDGKVVDHLTDTSTSNCNICGAKPTQMNNFAVLKKLDCKKEFYSFGLSTLHCWIRFLECLLHIAYRLPIKRWDARGDNKVIVNDTKKMIQDAFKEKTG